MLLENSGHHFAKRHLGSASGPIVEDLEGDGGVEAYVVSESRHGNGKMRLSRSGMKLEGQREISAASASMLVSKNVALLLGFLERKEDLLWSVRGLQAVTR